MYTLKEKKKNADKASWSLQFSLSISPPFIPSLFLRAKFAILLMLVILRGLLMFLFHRFAHLFRSRGFEIEAGEPRLISHLISTHLQPRLLRGWQRLKWLSNFTCSSGGWGENAWKSQGSSGTEVWRVKCTVACPELVGLSIGCEFYCLSLSLALYILCFVHSLSFFGLASSVWTYTVNKLRHFLNLNPPEE